MKKFRYCMLAAVLGLGTLVAFTGCGQITDEAKKEEVFAALEKAEISSFDFTSELSVKQETKSGDGSKSNTASQTTSASAYEKDDLLYGDLYTNASSKSVEETKSEKTTNTSNKYGVSFARGENVYSADGNWADTRARAGEFDTLMSEYLETGKLLTRSNGAESSFDVEEYAAYSSFSKFDDGKIYQDGKGYRIEIDVVKSASAAFDKLVAAAGYYTKHPDCTVAELFKAAKIAGMEEILLGDGSGEKRADEVFAPPSGFSANLARAQKDPEVFLLEKLFGFRAAAGNKGSFDFTVKAKLNGKMALTELRVAMNAQTKETEDDGDGNTTKSVKENFTLTVPEATPVLRDLTGLRADAGYRLKLGVYEIPRTSTCLYLEDLYDWTEWVDGHCSGTLTVTDNQIILNVTFQEDGGSRVLNESRRYDLTDEVYDNEELFTGKTFSDGRRVASDSGVFYSISAYPSWGSFYMNGETIDVPAEKRIVTL